MRRRGHIVRSLEFKTINNFSSINQTKFATDGG